MDYTQKQQLQDGISDAADIIHKFYIEYLNYFTTNVSTFARDKGVTEEEARLQIEFGREIHHHRTSK